TTLANPNLTTAASPSAFSSAYKKVVLRDMAVSGGDVFLQGSWVRIADLEPPVGEPSTSPDGSWSNLRGTNAFYETMVYYHLDANQRYIQSLGFSPKDRPILARPLQADADGVGGMDDSHYDADLEILAFGHGGCVPDDEDVDVILHEYGHAIQHAIVGGAWKGGDTGAMGE